MYNLLGDVQTCLKDLYFYIFTGTVVIARPISA